MRQRERCWGLSKGGRFVGQRSDPKPYMTFRAQHAVCALQLDAKNIDPGHKRLTVWNRLPSDRRNGLSKQVELERDRLTNRSRRVVNNSSFSRRRECSRIGPRRGLVYSSLRIHESPDQGLLTPEPPDPT